MSDDVNKLSYSILQPGIKTPENVIVFLDELSSMGYEAETSYAQNGWTHYFRYGIPSILVEKDCWIVEYRPVPFPTGFFLDQRIQPSSNTEPPRYRVFQAD